MHPSHFGRTAALALTALALLLPTSPAAAQAPIQIAVFPPLQIVDESEAVRGLRLSIYGSNAAMTGLDLGFISRTRGPFEGLQLGLVGFNEADARGIQWTAVNVVEGALLGAQIGVVNSAAGGEGFQWGGFNHTRNFRGLQIGLVNYAERLNGVQLGLINIIREGGVLPVMPLINWSLD